MTDTNDDPYADLKQHRATPEMLTGAIDPSGGQLVATTAVAPLQSGGRLAAGTTVIRTVPRVLVPTISSLST